MIMKQIVIRIHLTAAALLMLFMSATSFGQSAGGWDLTWNSIDTGGVKIAGGAFTLDTVIGQPDANPAALTGGAFTLTGGVLSSTLPARRNAIERWVLYE
jgi:hypothetical protein